MTQRPHVSRWTLLNTSSDTFSGHPTDQVADKQHNALFWLRVDQQGGRIGHSGLSRPLPLSELKFWKKSEISGDVESHEVRTSKF